MRNKRRVFVNEYLKDFNATQAAIRAGYSVKTARSIGQRLLTYDDISIAIDAEITKRGMGKEDVIFGLAQIARGDIADLMDITPLGFTLQLMHDGADGQKIINPKTKLIRKIKQKVTTFIAKKESDEDREIVETEIELYSSFDAYVQLGRYHKLFTDKSESEDKTLLRIEYANTPYPTPDVSSGASGDIPEPEEV